MLATREIAVLVHNVDRDLCRAFKMIVPERWTRIPFEDQDELIKKVHDYYKGDTIKKEYENPIQQAQYQMFISVVDSVKVLWGGK